jgi:mercuric ion transport protein
MTVKMAIGSTLSAAAASACCLGPIVLSVVGAGALSVTATRLEAVRPYFLGLTVVLLVLGFHRAYRPAGEICSADGTCTPSSKRSARIVLWIATAVVLLLAAFPWYSPWLL